MIDPGLTVAPERWRERPPEARRPWLEGYLAAELGRLCRQPAAAFGPERPVTSCGLDSIEAVELGVAIGLADILEGPTVGELATRIAAQAHPQGATLAFQAVLASAPARPAEYPLSHNQRALWFLQRLQPDGTAYNIAAAAQVEPALEMATLRRTLERLAARHSVLKLAFGESASGPVQWVRPDGGTKLTKHEAHGWSPEQIAAFVQAAASRPFDLERESPLRIVVLHGLPTS